MCCINSIKESKTIPHFLDPDPDPELRLDGPEVHSQVFRRNKLIILYSQSKD